MPIYEFQCECCNECFEQLVFAGDKEEVACPKCNKTNVKRLMSVASCIGLSSDNSCSPGASRGFS
ncbi:MAG: zinc ribbon domain-containing protein [Deltaproteobacteria bacterium]|nr:zinc ribbon domain-containing protein [Deltaproteobacteria bacterium]MBW1962556.1 zinc ribbon domain-containing protein [Deltaproteobacteria bacterium]MBW1995804.1 zinc ribbon domain-containing protein [Deltaproteobacteria bacterium]MBW2153043.1 zinc ribbon domain-containing protein [Deltaproteobacteria bacterium]